MLSPTPTHEVSGADARTDLTIDEAENAAMHVANWLRRLSMLSVTVLLPDERWPGKDFIPMVDTSAYKPITNVTANYRWAHGARTMQWTFPRLRWPWSSSCRRTG